MKFNFWKPRFIAEDLGSALRQGSGEAAEEEISVLFPRINEGMPLELAAGRGDPLLSGRMTQFSKETLTLERIPGTLSFPLLETGLPITVRGYDSGMEPVNLSGSVVESTRVRCVIGELALVPYQNQRKNSRQPIDIPANFYALSDRHMAKPQKCRVTDISAGGARVISRSAYSVGEALRLRLELVKGEGYTSYWGEIVRAEAAGDGNFEYGFLFEQLNRRQIDALTRDIQRIQRELMQKLEV